MIIIGFLVVFFCVLGVARLLGFTIGVVFMALCAPLFLLGGVLTDLWRWLRRA
jgi:hypothetical protein